jgi:hypothetical protein
MRAMKSTMEGFLRKEKKNEEKDGKMEANSTKQSMICLE